MIHGMHPSGFENRRRLEQLGLEEKQAYQLQKLNHLLAQILPHNTFYAHKLAGLRLPLTSLEQLGEMPLTTKVELQQQGTFAANRSFPTERYVRFHRTSGTHGRPMIVLDTDEDWQWWIDTWQFVLDAAQVAPADRVFMAFSFGPFIGFWSAHDAVLQRGALAIPAGGLSSEARLDLLAASAATVLCCTPTYALRLAEVAQEIGVDVRRTSISRIIVAGEPGGSVPAIRSRIEASWDARVVDHAGSSEVGPWGYADADDRGLHVVESEFIAEFLPVEDTTSEGRVSELILTTLGRLGAPVIRYRTGDLVRPVSRSEHGNQFTFLDGGVLGRADDMLVIRGMNIFPSAIEQILRTFPEVVEYRIVAQKRGEMDSLSIQVEDLLGEPNRIERALQIGLGLHVHVQLEEHGSLPRFEAKGKRFVDQRKSAS